MKRILFIFLASLFLNCGFYQITNQEEKSNEIPSEALMLSLLASSNNSGGGGGIGQGTNQVIFSIDGEEYSWSGFTSLGFLCFKNSYCVAIFNEAEPLSESNIASNTTSTGSENHLFIDIESPGVGTYIGDGTNNNDNDISYYDSNDNAYRVHTALSFLNFDGDSIKIIIDTWSTSLVSGSFSGTVSSFFINADNKYYNDQKTISGNFTSLYSGEIDEPSFARNMDDVIDKKQIIKDHIIKKILCQRGN